MVHWTWFPWRKQSNSSIMRTLRLYHISKTPPSLPYLTKSLYQAIYIKVISLPLYGIHLGASPIHTLSPSNHPRSSPTCQPITPVIGYIFTPTLEVTSLLEAVISTYCSILSYYHAPPHYILESNQLSHPSPASR